MAKITNILQGARFNIDSSLNTKNIQKRFGKKEDNVELFILDINDNIVFTEENFTEYLADEIKEGLFSEFNMDPITLLRNKGFTTGKYKLVLNIHRKKVFNSFDKNFKITEISPSRKEIRTVGKNISEEALETQIRSFIRDIETSVLFKDFSLNFGSNQISTAINIKLNKRGRSLEILFKLFEPLPNNISNNSVFRIVEEITDPIFLNVDMGTPEELDITEQLQGPNFKIDIRLNNSVPSAFKTYNDVLNYSLTSSYQNLLNQLDNREVPNITYDAIRPVSSSLEAVDIPYHFENFVHFSSAVERLKNFEYKLKLIEQYDNQVRDISEIPGSTSSSTTVLTAKEDINTKKEKLIQGFDGYEQFLYFTSGSDYTWPKQTTTYPYQLFHTSHSTAKTWLGDERDTFPNYGGQLLSASLYDRQNEYKLTNLVPNHITDNPDNVFYKTFVDMVGHHFDLIWTHIKAITDINNNSNIKGISKDLVYLQLKSLGIEAFDQFENSNLIEYILGHGTGSSTFYDTPANQTLVTASNEGSTPKQDIAKEVWKRLYHNAPYLLKTKGTERGIKALMSCYGVPASILNVKEYAGSTSAIGLAKDLNLADFYKTFTYEKASLALRGDSGTDGFFIQAPFSSSVLDNHFSTSDLENQAIEFRIKPIRLETNQHLFSLSGSLNHYHDQHIIAIPYTGTDISSSGDAKQYGSLRYLDGTATINTTEVFPLYNGDFWNVFLNVSKLTGLGASHSSSIEFGVYQANFNKNISKYISSGIVSSSTAHYSNTFGLGSNKAKFMFFGGIPANSSAGYNLVDGLKYSGSLQEIRYYVKENLTDSTLTKHALEPFMYAGNSISSSYDNLVLRLPLGSNDQQNSSSFHPNIDVSFLGMDDGVSSSMDSQEWEEVIQNHYHPTPDTVGISMTSEKVRIDEGTIDNNILSPIVKSETSTLDRQPPDYEDLGVFFSPTNELNEDIIYTLGSFRLDDFIGSPLPSAQSSSNYSDLKTLKDIYFKKVKKRYNYFDYIKLIQYIDHTLFKVIEQFVPAKANLKTGLLIEPHYLERNKFERELPVLGDGITMTTGSYQTFNFQIDPERSLNLTGSSVVTTNNLSQLTGSKGFRLEQGTNVTIDIDDYILDETQNIAQAPITPVTGIKTSNILLGNATKGRLSSIYYRKLIDGKQTDY